MDNQIINVDFDENYWEDILSNIKLWTNEDTQE
jgi:hypothetical protein